MHVCYMWMYVHCRCILDVRVCMYVTTYARMYTVCICICEYVNMYTADIY